jgi:fructosamine-3-kinase
MWQSIERAIEQKTGQTFTANEQYPTSGGDTHLSFTLASTRNKEQPQYFVKLNGKNCAAHFAAEADALEQLSLANTIHCPKVITLGTSRDKSFIVLNQLTFCPASPALWYQLGQQLANTHKQCTHEQFGWPQNNYIGATLQPNHWSSDWPTFFAEQRIAWQLQLLSDKSIILGDIAHISQVCHDALFDHCAEPCLVHGDLWQGNVGFTASGPVIFDPACYYADREVDIAMSELFGQFPCEFYQGYQSNYPLRKGYERRKNIYNFYHILNHANLFGGVYIEQAKATLSRLLPCSCCYSSSYSRSYSSS